MYFTMDKIKFGEWLSKYRTDLAMTQSELARKSGLHRQIINKIENGVSEPALKTYIALAEGLGLSLISILRTAGELPQGPENAVNFEDWQNRLQKLSPEDEAELRQIAELKIERRKKDQALKVLKTKKAG